MTDWIPTTPVRRRNLPAPRVGSRLQAALLVLPSFLALVLYSATLTPGVTGARSAELALRAWRLDVMDAGAGLWTVLLGFLPTHLFGEPVFGTSVVSALAATAAVGFVTATAFRLSRNAVTAGIAGTVFALAPAVWGCAIVTSPHALALAGFSGALFVFAAGVPRRRIIFGLGASMAAIAIVSWWRWPELAVAGRGEVVDALGSLTRASLASVFWVGVVPVWMGLGALGRRRRFACATFGAMLATAALGIVFSGRAGHADALLPLLAVACPVMASGLDELWAAGPRRRVLVALAGAAALLLGPAERAEDVGALRAESARQMAFLEESFVLFPRGALVAALPERAVALGYLQATRRLRPDVAIIERRDAEEVRAFERPGSWRAQAARAIAARPVLVDTPRHGLGLHEARSLDDTWHLIVRSGAGPFELPYTARLIAR